MVVSALTVALAVCSETDFFNSVKPSKNLVFKISNASFAVFSLIFVKSAAFFCASTIAFFTKSIDLAADSFVFPLAISADVSLTPAIAVLRISTCLLANAFTPSNTALDAPAKASKSFEHQYSFQN